MIKVVLVDDHPVVREGIKQILAESSDVSVEGEASNGHDLLRLLNQIEVDVIIMDISMPGLSGLDLLREIKAKHHNIPVLVLSIHPEEQYGVRMIKAGAAGYLPKDTAPKKLVGALRKIAQGHCYISPALAEKMALHLQIKDYPKTNIDCLSDREHQIFLLIAEGKTALQIASELDISAKTVGTYRTRLMEKMGFGSTVELIRYAFEHNLVK